MCHSQDQFKKPQRIHPHSCTWSIYIDVVNNPLSCFDCIYGIANESVMGMGKHRKKMYIFKHPRKIQVIPKNALQIV
jgi:hypothetical protein